MEKEYVRRRANDEGASEAVLQAVSAASNLSLRDLPPLQESVNVESLDRLFEPSNSAESVQFEYAGYEITFDGERVSLSEC